MADQCRWGILGTANIARKNWKAIWNSANATVVAVGSRTAERSAQFIDECQTQVPFATRPAACGSYDELLADPRLNVAGIGVDPSAVSSYRALFINKVGE